MIGTLLVAALLAAPPGALSEAALRARHGGLSALSADVGQVKEGRHWARPLRSQIKLRWSPARIQWETLTPVRSLVTIEGEVLTITDARGGARTLGAAGDPRFKALIELLRAFLALDLPRIERDFTLEYRGLELLARPRPGASLGVFTGLRFRFDDQLELRTLDLESADEQTHLTFENVVRERAGR
jgi:hypothetical protein